METRARCRPPRVGLGRRQVGYFSKFELFFQFVDEISPLFQSVFLVHSFHSFDSSFGVHSFVHETPHFPTSVVLRVDRQDGYRCFGPRIESVCHQNTSW